MKQSVKSSTNVNAATAYTDSSYTRGRQQFSVHTAYTADPDNLQCQIISEIPSYDLTNYAWAKKDQFSI